MSLPALDAATLADAFAATADAGGDRPALRALDGSSALSWRDYARRARAVAGGLAARGIGRGDTVALLLTQRPEFYICDTAALLLGATPFSIYLTSAPEQIADLLARSGARLVVTEPRLLEAVAAAESGLPVVLVAGEDAGAATTLGALEAAGAAAPEPADRPSPQDVATLIYTSGTTGAPKGVELTHANVLAQWRAMQSSAGIAPWGTALAYLPHAHIADRLVSQYQSLLFGTSLVTCPDPQGAIAALPQVRPTFFMAVPRIWEKLKAAVEAAGGEPLAAAVARALGGDPAPGDDAAHLAPLRARLGLDRAAHLWSGGAPIGPHVLRFFAAVGLPLRTGLGMSEAGTVTMTPVDDPRPGTVGRALPGYELRLAAGDGGPRAGGPGELLVRGPGVMRGYRGDAERTAEALDADGWLHTGDVAEIAEDGFVTIVDRKKEILVSAAGKNMSPVQIEHTLKSECPLVGQACVVGDARPYNVALLVLDPDAAAAWRRGTGADEAALVAAVEDGVRRANARLSRPEQIKRFVLLDDEWLPDSEILTPTMKLKRRGVAAAYAAEIEALYAAGRDVFALPRPAAVTP